MSCLIAQASSLLAIPLFARFARFLSPRFKFLAGFWIWRQAQRHAKHRILQDGIAGDIGRLK
jgi:hypothetical protein